MHAAVIDERHLDDVVAAGLEQAGNGISEEVVADMSEMERLVGVRRRELHHDVASGRRQYAEARVGCYLREEFTPPKLRKADVEKAFDDVERTDLRDVGGEPVPYGLSRSIRRRVGYPQQRKHHQGIVTLEILPGDLHLEVRGLDVSIVQVLYGQDGLAGNERFGCHQPR